ncbi:hypothetical protein ACLOJK_041455 [Asimina triloba]
MYRLGQSLVSQLIAPLLCRPHSRTAGHLLFRARALAAAMSFRRRAPFAPFLNRLPAAEDCESHDLEESVKHHLVEISLEIEKIERFLRSTGEWTEEWVEFIRGEFVDLVRKIDESMVDDESQPRPPPSEIQIRKDETSAFFRTPKGKQLLQDLSNGMQAFTNRLEELGSKALLDLPHPPPSTASGFSSSHRENGVKEVTKHEEELQRRAEEVKEEDPGEFFLQLSYDDLEHQLKQYLLYFAAFPANHLIKKRTIIYWWIGEGLVRTSRDGRTAEQVGEDIFKMLLASGLIQPIYQKLSRTANYCKIYPWVREMLVSKAREENSFVFFPDEVVGFDSRPGPILNHDSCKRSCLSVKDNDDKVSLAVSSEGKANECISLFNYNVHYLRCDEEKLEKFKAMAAFQLGRWQNLSSHHVEVDNDSFLNGLQFMTQLKYLSLHGISRITELPGAIGSLANLLILDLRSCHNLESVPAAVTSLSSLTHLDVSGCYLLDKMPRGIGSMSNLQVLKGFVVGGARSRDPCQLSELAQLQKLWKLSIRIGSEAQADDDLGQLTEIKSLRSLRITWGQVKQVKHSPGLTRRKSTLSKSKTGGMRGFPSFPDLEKLVLECVPDDVVSVSPLVLNDFNKLKRLYIEGGKLSKLSFTCRDEEWKIEILRLKFLRNLRLEGINFGKLVSEPVEWTDVTMKWLPKLRGAQIIECPEIGFALDLAGFDEKGIWERSSEPKIIHGLGGGGVGNMNEATSSSNSMVGTSLVSDIEELSSSSIAGTG